MSSAFYRTFESAVIVSTVGIEGKLVRSIIGKTSAKSYSSCSPERRQCSLDDVFSIFFCQMAVLPTVGVVVFIGSIDPIFPWAMSRFKPLGELDSFLV